MYRYKKKRLSRQKTKDLHRVLMEEKLGRTLSRYEVVHHIDGDSLNNDVTNLEVMSLSEHSRMHMLQIKPKPPPIYYGEENSQSKLKVWQVLEIRRLYQDTELGSRRLARMFNMSKRAIEDVCKRHTWKYI